MSAPQQALQSTTKRPEASIPFVVDLDGTLLKSDALFECAMAFVRSQPWRCLTLLGWLIQGKAYLKKQLAQSTYIDVSLLPYNPDVLGEL
ncbi:MULTISPECIES: hypothetical protein [unclassified Pseudomonas]|uniref:hypothetical protein n=1 Tax=unclassified Pseudomonas TaxID=196821 RepID=UPI0030D7373B